MINIKNINQLIIYGIILVIILTSFFTFIIINNAYNEFQEKITIIEKEYFKNQKEKIKTDIDKTLSFIEYMHKRYKNSKSEEWIKNEVLIALDYMRNKKEKERYVFIYNFNGAVVYDPILKQNVGRNLMDYIDPTGKKVIKELIHMSKYKSGGYVEYSWNKPFANKVLPKISYAKSYDKWNWTIGEGVYLDDVKRMIKAEQEAYDQKISKYIIQILSLTLLLVFNSIFIYRYATFLIAKEIEIIDGYLKTHEHLGRDSYEPLNQNKIYFKEFRSIIKYANDLIKNVKIKTDDLEEEVQDKAQKLEKLLKAQDEFIKKSIHEINTPLSIIQTNIDLLKMKNIQSKQITNIESGAKIIHNIYNDLSFLVKKDVVEYTKKEINISEFLKERISFFNEVAASNSLFFITNIQNDMFIQFNDIELQRVIDNNISNAIKYSFPDSPIYLKLVKEENKTIFEVKTHSETIKEPNKIFNNYYRENVARGGFGLGLNIVKEICDKNLVIIELISNKEETKFIYRFNDENTVA